MIEISRSAVAGGGGRVMVIGVGGAGSHVVERGLSGNGEGLDCWVANTDARALNASSVEKRMVLGQRLTRGLGTGGDPDLGRAAVEESLELVQVALESVGLLIVVAGLGGGTGSGGLPRVVEVAKERGIRVAALVTLPFSFEGKRRMEQAEASLGRLRVLADVVVCFENDRMSSLADSSGGIDGAFATVDGVMGRAVCSMARVHQKAGILSTGFDEIGAVLCGANAEAFFGYGYGEGEERMNRAIRAALESPLLSRCPWGEVSAVWVNCVAGEDVRWMELQGALEALQGWFPREARLFFGVGVDSALAGGVEFSILAGGLSVSGVGRAESGVGANKVFEALRAERGGEIERNELFSSSVGLELESEWGLGAARVAESHPAGGGEQERGQAQSSEEVVDSGASASVPGDGLAGTLEASEREEAEEEPGAVGEASGEEAGAYLPDPEELRRDVGAALMKRRIAERLLSARESRGEVEESPEDAKRGTEEAGAESGQGVTATEELRLSPELGASGIARPKPAVQEQMHFEPANRGRFEKTDPTMVDGQDLDVPTFMRQGVSLSRDEEPPQR